MSIIYDFHESLKSSLVELSDQAFQNITQWDASGKKHPLSLRDVNHLVQFSLVVLYLLIVFDVKRLKTAIWRNRIET